MGNPVLETVTGKLVDVVNPTPDMIDFEDIAWSLSRQSRFNGHTITLIPYSVAQHSIQVAARVSTFTTNVHVIMAALLHDAAEAYISDIPSPIKNIEGFRSHIKQIEDKITNVIFEALDVPYPTEGEWKTIKDADKWCQAIEAHAFMSSRGSHWQGLPKPDLIELQRFSTPMESTDAYFAFRQYMEQLVLERK